MREEKIINEAEKLRDDQLENVIGGILTAYFFMCTKFDGQYYYTKDPISVGAATEPLDFIKKNLELFEDMLNHNELEISDSSPTSKFQDFANKNASQWSDPTTWGNVVFAVDPISGDVSNYTA